MIRENERRLIGKLLIVFSNFIIISLYIYIYIFIIFMETSRFYHGFCRFSPKYLQSFGILVPLQRPRLTNSLSFKFNSPM